MIAKNRILYRLGALGGAFLLLCLLLGSTLGQEPAPLPANQSNIAQSNGRIQGIVTSEADGQPLAGIHVNVYRYQEQGVPGEAIGGMITGADGKYVVDNLDVDLYHVEFNDWSRNYLREFFDNKPDYLHADDVYVGPDATITVDAALTETGKIAGQVTFHLDGSPISGIQIAVHDFNEENGSWGCCWVGESAADGSYEIKGLDPGIYRVQFRDESTQFYVNQFYSNAWNLQTATNIVVTSGGTTTANVELVRAGHISGQVNNNYFDVRAYYQEDGLWKEAKSYGSNPSFGYSSTYNDGYYEFRGLKADWYLIEFDDYEEYEEGYSVMGYYDGVSDWTQATPVRVHLSQVTTGIDATFTKPFAPWIDQIDNSSRLDGSEFSDQQPLSEATTDPDDPVVPCLGEPNSASGHTIWYAHYSYQDERLDLSVSEPDGVFDLAVWTGGKGYLNNVVCAHGQPLEDVLLQAGKTYYIEVAAVNPPEGDVTVSASITLDDVQEILLKGSWNLVSSYIEPFYNDFITLFAPISNELVLVKDEYGRIYWPDQGIYELGSWYPRQAYQIYMNSAATLTNGGLEIDPQETSIHLLPGWSNVAYLRTSPMAVNQALATIQDQLVLVKDGMGQIYWPAFGINQIGDMVPGQGYQVYLQDAGKITYPANN